MTMRDSLKRILSFLIVLVLAFPAVSICEESYTAEDVYSMLSEEKKETMKSLWISLASVPIYEEEEIYNVSDDKYGYNLTGKEMGKLYELIMSLPDDSPFSDKDQDNKDSLDNNRSSIDEAAINYYCDEWNNYFLSNREDIKLLFEPRPTDDKSNILIANYNSLNRVVSYPSKLIPETACIMFNFLFDSFTFDFLIFDAAIEENLQSLTIYVGDEVITPEYFESKKNERKGYWAFSFDSDQVMAIFKADEVTARITTTEETDFFEINSRDNVILYDMIQSLYGGLFYSEKKGQFFQDTRYLPSNMIRKTGVAEPTPEPKYSFQEDLDGIEKAAKSVFYVEVLDENADIIGSASGFVAFDEHLFVTNQHVIQDAWYLRVVDDDGYYYIINQVVMSDEMRDIAILLFPEGSKYEPLEMDSEEKLRRGQPVTTIGSPIGYKGTVAYGNISAFPTLKDYGDLELIQFTAPTSQGSSGGCLFDDNGKLIGVTSAGGISSYTQQPGQNIGLAVPISVVQELYSKWDKSDFEYLGTERSYNMVGVTPTPVPTPTPSPTPAPSPTPEPAPTPQLGEYINRFGLTKMKVFLFDELSNKAFPKVILNRDTYVYMIQLVEDQSGNRWLRILYDGKEFYADPTGINMSLSIAESDAYMTTLPTAVPEITPIITPVPTPTPTPTPSPTPTLSPTPTPPPTPTPSPTPDLQHFSDKAQYKIKLNADYIELFIKETFDIKASAVRFADESSIKAEMIYNSSDETVATVSNKGRIVAVAPGIAMITCAAKDDPDIYTILFVKVKQEVKKLSIVPSDEKDLSISSSHDGTNVEKKESTIYTNLEDEKKTIQLKAIVDPDDATYSNVKWSSSDPSIASVDENGMVSAIKPGKVTITAITEDGASKKPLKSTYIINVKVGATAINITNGNLSLYIGDKCTLIAAILPTNVTTKALEWTSSDTNIATVDNKGNVKCISPGTCTIICRATDGTNNESSIPITVGKRITGLEAISKTLSISEGYPYNFTENIKFIPDDATNEKLRWEVSAGNEKVEITEDLFEWLTSRPIVCYLTAYTTDGSNKSAKFKVIITPADGNGLHMGNYASWDYHNASDQLSIKFNVTNEEYGKEVIAFELYVYATDSWGNKLYGQSSVYYHTTNKTVAPGQTVYSDYITIPQLRNIRNVYAGISQVLLSNGKKITISDVDYDHWTID